MNRVNTTVTKKRTNEQINRIIARIRRAHEEQSIPLPKRCKKFGPVVIGFFRNLEWEKNKSILTLDESSKKKKKQRKLKRVGFKGMIKKFAKRA